MCVFKIKVLHVEMVYLFLQNQFLKRYVLVIYNCTTYILRNVNVVHSLFSKNKQGSDSCQDIMIISRRDLNKKLIPQLFFGRILLQMEIRLRIDYQNSTFRNKFKKKKKNYQAQLKCLLINNIRLKPNIACTFVTKSVLVTAKCMVVSIM